MQYAAAYAAALIVFGVLDAMWLITMASRLYRPVLGDILLPDLRMAPALVFYFMYPLGLVIFAIAPALKSGSWSTAVIQGAMFGAFAYATYDLTNYATLRNWTLGITVIDIVYGACVAAVVSAIGFAAARLVSGYLG